MELTDIIAPVLLHSMDPVVNKVSIHQYKDNIIFAYL